MFYVCLDTFDQTLVVQHDYINMLLANKMCLYYWWEVCFVVYNVTKADISYVQFASSCLRCGFRDVSFTGNIREGINSYRDVLFYFSDMSVKCVKTSPALSCPRRIIRKVTVQYHTLLVKKACMLIYWPVFLRICKGTQVMTFLFGRPHFWPKKIQS